MFVCVRMRACVCFCVCVRVTMTGVNSLYAIMFAAASTPMQTISGFLLGVENSGWLKHIHLVLEASIFCAKVRYLLGILKCQLSVTN